MLGGRDPNGLAPWLADAERGELRPLAPNLRRDRDAVLAAGCFRWSNGQVEGQVNRPKLVKRTVYGRAGFAVLRRRVLAASGVAASPRACIRHSARARTGPSCSSRQHSRCAGAERLLTAPHASHENGAPATV